MNSGKYRKKLNAKTFQLIAIVQGKIYDSSMMTRPEKGNHSVNKFCTLTRSLHAYRLLYHANYMPIRMHCRVESRLVCN